MSRRVRMPLLGCARQALHRNASAIGIYGVNSRIVRFENRQPASVRFLHGQGHALPNAHNHLIECRSYKRHCLKIGEWPLAFNGDSYGVGTARDCKSCWPATSTAGSSPVVGAWP